MTPAGANAPSAEPAPQDLGGSDITGRSGRTVLKGASWNTVGQLAPLVTNLVLTPYLVHGFGLDRYGLYMLVVTFGTFFSSFDGGVGASAQRYFSVYAGTDDRAATTRLLVTVAAMITATSLVLFGGAYLAAPWCVDLFQVPAGLRGEAVFLLRTSVVVAGVSSVRGLFAAVLASRQRFAFAAGVGLLLHGVYTVAAIITLARGLGLRGLAVGLLVQTVLVTALIVPAAARYLSLDGLHFLTLAELRTFLGFSARVQLVGMATLVNTNADAVVTGWFLPVRFVGYLQAGAGFGNQLRKLPMNALAPIQSTLGQAFGASGEAGAVVLAARLQRAWVVATTGFSVVASAAAYFAVTAWLGPGYQLAGLISTIVIAGNAPALWSGVAAVWATICGRPQIEARVAVTSVLVNVLVTLSLVRPFGVVGVVTATALGQIFSAGYLARLVRVGLEHPLEGFFPQVPVVASLAAAGLCVAAEAVAAPFLPHGAVGLLCAGAVAAPALGLYASLVPSARAAIRTWTASGAWRCRAGSTPVES